MASRVYSQSFDQRQLLVLYNSMVARGMRAKVLVKLAVGVQVTVDRLEA